MRLSELARIVSLKECRRRSRAEDFTGEGTGNILVPARPAQNHLAFTLIEQLAALALASLLMLAAFGVLAAAARDSVEHSPDTERASFERAADLIGQDLIDARRMKAGTDQIVLSGFDSLNADTPHPDHRPVRVTYRIERDGESGRLVRRQEYLDVLSNQNGWSDLVCDGVDRLEIIPLFLPPPPSTTAWADPFNAADGDEIGGSVRLVLTSVPSRKTIVDRILCLK